MGPNKAAYCELEDSRDGTFELRMKPQETGRHVLQVKYGGEHVQGNMLIVISALYTPAWWVGGPSHKKS